MLQALLALVPGIARPNSDLRPITVERYCRDGVWKFRVLAKAFLDFMVPDRYRPVRACGGKGVVPVGTVQ